MSLNRPFDTARQTNSSGGWAWVNNPQVSEPPHLPPFSKAAFMLL
jgi:hypothetical protein